MNSVISATSSDFPTGLPPIASNLLRLPESAYTAIKLNSYKLRRSQSFSEILAEAKAFGDRFNLATSTMRDLLTDFDMSEVLPTTTALGFHKPSHTELEERGKVGEDSSFQCDDDVIAAIIKFYSMFPYDSELDRALKMSMTRGTLIGWPYLFSGASRDLNNALLSVNAALAQACDAKGLTLMDVVRYFEQSHGSVFFPYGERYQHTSKTMPMWTAEGVKFSKNFEPRVRAIIPSSKFMVARLRRPVKKMLSRILKTPIHNQDRSVIRSRIDTAIKKGWHVSAIDYSKFDQHHGYPRSKKLLKAIYEMNGEMKLYEEAEYEFLIPKLAYAKTGVYLTPGELFLASGISSTTVIGCVGNLASVIQVLKWHTGLSPDEIFAKRGVEWDMLSWGDDTVYMASNSFPTLDEMKPLFKRAKLKVDEEPVIKYLGSVYNKGQFKGSVDMGYSVGRAIQQTEFPERMKLFPFATVGIIARTEMLQESKRAEFFSRLQKNLWNEEKYGPKFEWNDRKDVIQKLLPEIEKQSLKISSMDDIITMISHGVRENYLDMLPDHMEYFEGLLGMTDADVTDPLKYLNENSESLKSVESFSNGISTILKGDLNGLSVIAAGLSANSMRLVPNNPWY